MYTCCGLPSSIAEVGITGPKWHEIKTAVICKTLPETLQVHLGFTPKGGRGHLASPKRGQIALTSSKRGEIAFGMLENMSKMAL
jgi:hypothetical protein